MNTTPIQNAASPTRIDTSAAASSSAHDFSATPSPSSRSPRRSVMSLFRRSGSQSQLPSLTPQNAATPPRTPNAAPQATTHQTAPPLNPPMPIHNFELDSHLDMEGPNGEAPAYVHRPFIPPPYMDQLPAANHQAQNGNNATAAPAVQHNHAVTTPQIPDAKPESRYYPRYQAMEQMLHKTEHVPAKLQAKLDKHQASSIPGAGTLILGIKDTFKNPTGKKAIPYAGIVHTISSGEEKRTAQLKDKIDRTHVVRGKLREKMEDFRRWNHIDESVVKDLQKEVDALTKPTSKVDKYLRV